MLAFLYDFYHHFYISGGGRNIGAAQKKHSGKSEETATQIIGKIGKITVAMSMYWICEKKVFFTLNL